MSELSGVTTPVEGDLAKDALGQEYLWTEGRWVIIMDTMKPREIDEMELRPLGDGDAVYVMFATLDGRMFTKDEASELVNLFIDHYGHSEML